MKLTKDQSALLIDEFEGLLKEPSEQTLKDMFISIDGIKEIINKFTEKKFPEVNDIDSPLAVSGMASKYIFNLDELGHKIWLINEYNLQWELEDFKKFAGHVNKIVEWINERGNDYAT